MSAPMPPIGNLTQASGDRDDLVFADEADLLDPAAGPATWRILVVDDDADVHSTTTFALNKVEMQGRPLEFLHAYSAGEARAILARQPEVAVVLLDVVMERPDAGLQLVRRAHRAANFALGFAVHRMDPDAAMLHQAALLHDFAEMLLWCHAPALALRIRHAQRADPALRSSVAQRAVLNVELPDLQHALMQRWRLPELLVRITDDRQAAHTEVQNVLLGVRVARHTADGWDNAAIPDDVRDVAQLLHLSEPAALKLLEELDT